MGGVTRWVRIALAELGQDAPDADIKAYIREKAPDVPQSQIGLALRKLRGATIPKSKPGSRKGSA
jgi:hypothetical protein